MTLLGWAETSADVTLWGELGVRSCVPVEFTCEGEGGWIDAVIDTSREPSLGMWLGVVDAYLPSRLFGPVCYDGGEVGSWFDRTCASLQGRGVTVIPRVCGDSALSGIARPGLNIVGLDWETSGEGWEHWLLGDVEVWLTGASSPRDQWLTWLELKHRDVVVSGILIPPPSSYNTHRLHPSNLTQMQAEANSVVCGEINSKVIVAFWESVLPESMMLTVG